MSRKEGISNFGIIRAIFGASVLLLTTTSLAAECRAQVAYWIDRYGLPRILELLRALVAGEPFDTAADLLVP